MESHDKSFTDVYEMDVNRFPLMSSPIPVTVIMAMYLLFVLKIGPNVMKHRMPLELSSVLPVYNAVQVGLSAYLAYRYFIFMYKTADFLHAECHINDSKYRSEVRSILHFIFLTDYSLPKKRLMRCLEVFVNYLSYYVQKLIDHEKSTDSENTFTEPPCLKSSSDERTRPILGFKNTSFTLSHRIEVIKLNIFTNPCLNKYDSRVHAFPPIIPVS
ncbi:uncharacterized protein LOC105392997 [Plutella xylostella]|uniref:uncharacterized protein LOC105392997 n=1 Tax=Plutella xylostella TaxID=51655 RepID=UPI00203284E9|nr:uncharacterized protein LOC105392997 [Plutella xylostella]